jgi:hypothetical protein
MDGQNMDALSEGSQGTKHRGRRRSRIQYIP